jgi:hypothetical protein
MDRIYKRPFLWPEPYRRTGRVSIAFPLDEKRDVVPGGSGGERLGGALKDSLGRRSLELRASSAVGSRWQAVFSSSDRLE